jgi:hypothetical protein
MLTISYHSTDVQQAYQVLAPRFAVVRQLITLREQRV